jgi:outer membrane biosynthesis protein TonB
MRVRWIAVVALALSYGFGPGSPAQSQQSSSGAGRRIVSKVNPSYPVPALRMNLGGTVKVVALVAADGSVKKVEPVGGPPILIQAAQNAVAQWKYAPGSESRETVELHFTP